MSGGARSRGDIIETQTSEIDQMLRWRDQWHPDRAIQDGHEPVVTHDLSNFREDDLERAVLEDMIPHHNGRRDGLPTTA